MATFTFDPWGHLSEEQVRARCRELSRLSINRGERVERLEAALTLLADDDTYLRHLSEWHDTGHMQRGVQAIARAALEKR